MPARPRVLSSVGRASPLQGECREFDPLSTHQQERASEFAGVVVQLVRIPACHAGGRGFESRPLRQQISGKENQRGVNKQQPTLATAASALRRRFGNNDDCRIARFALLAFVSLLTFGARRLFFLCYVGRASAI